MGNNKTTKSNNKFEKIWINKINNESIINFSMLDGGVSSEVYKVTTKSKIYCIKRSLSKLLVKKDWYADTKRLKYEYLWLKHCSKIIPNNIPKIYKFSSKLDILILEFLDEKKYETLKSKLLNKNIDKKIFVKISKDLFKIHKNSSNDIIKKMFTKNSKNFYDLRLDAYFNEVGRVYPFLNNKIKKIIKDYKKNSSTLVHGDFSPKNMLIYKKNIKYIDAETCNFGDPVFDVVFFSNHLLIKSIHIPNKKKQFIEAYKIFFQTYIKSIKLYHRENFMNRSIEMIPIMLLARIDGKSPVEYITKKNIKNKIRSLSFKLLSNPPTSLKNLLKKII